MERTPMPRCPICKQPLEARDAPHRPFCSARCRMIDLGRWLGGDYAIPGPTAPPDAPWDVSEGRDDG